VVGTIVGKWKSRYYVAVNQAPELYSENISLGFDVKDYAQ